MEKTEALAVRPATAVARRDFSLLPSTLGEAREMAEMIARSDFAPKDYKGKPENIIIAVQMGADLGLKPMQALQNIAVINGRPSIYGDAALALVMSILDRFTEKVEGDGDSMVATCTARRRGWPDDTTRTFSVADAKLANLWGKQGPWTQYPKRMLQFRARGFTLRDVAPDLMLGLVLAEEAGDYPTESGQAIDATVVPAAEVVADPMARVPDAFRDNIEKGFASLTMSAAQRLAKLNEFFGKPETTPEDAAQQLLDWMRDEFSKRKTGSPRKKAENGKTPTPAPPSSPPAPAVTATEAPATAPEPSRGDTAPTSQPHPALVSEELFQAWF